MFAHASNQSSLSRDSPLGVAPWEQQFPCIAQEFQEYYNEKCKSCSRQ